MSSFDRPMFSVIGSLSHRDSLSLPFSFSFLLWFGLGDRFLLGIVRVHPRLGAYMMSRYLWSSDISTRGHSRGMGPC